MAISAKQEINLMDEKEKFRKIVIFCKLEISLISKTNWHIDQKRIRPIFPRETRFSWQSK